MKRKMKRKIIMLILLPDTQRTYCSLGMLHTCLLTSIIINQHSNKLQTRSLDGDASRNLFLLSVLSHSRDIYIKLTLRPVSGECTARSPERHGNSNTISHEEPL